VNAAFAGGNFNGITRFADSLVEGLYRAGHDVVVYSSAKHYKSNPQITVCETPSRLRSEYGALGNLSRFLWTSTTLPGQVKRGRADLLITPNPEGAVRSSVPQIVTVHDVIPLFYREENPRQHFLYKYVLPSILARATRILVVSEYTRQDVIRSYNVPPERVLLVYTGIRDDLFEDRPGYPPAGHQPGPFFLFVGTFSPRKNLATVIRAFAAIAKDVPERLVVVAYPDRWMESVMQLASDLRIMDRMVLFHGLPDAQFSYLQRNATALVLLSEYEGLGLPPLEAMAVGTPAIASSSTSLAEVTGDAAIQVPCKDVDAAAAAMRTLSQSPGLRDSLRAKGKQHARNFDCKQGREQIDRALGSFCAAAHCRTRYA
jgi:glycosyltransferase involved in cell wall biosynthesis